MAVDSGCLIDFLVSVAPVPGKQFIEPMDWMRSDLRQDIGEPGVVKLAIAAIGIGLEDSAVAGQMRLRMFAGAIA